MYTSPRDKLSTEDKRQIVRRIDAGHSKLAIADHFDIPVASVSIVLKQRDDYEEDFENFLKDLEDQENSRKQKSYHTKEDESINKSTVTSTTPEKLTTSIDTIPDESNIEPALDSFDGTSSDSDPKSDDAILNLSKNHSKIVLLNKLPTSIINDKMSAYNKREIPDMSDSRDSDESMDFKKVVESKPLLNEAAILPELISVDFIDELELDEPESLKAEQNKNKPDLNEGDYTKNGEHPEFLIKKRSKHEESNQSHASILNINQLVQDDQNEANSPYQPDSLFSLPQPDFKAKLDLMYKTVKLMHGRFLKLRKEFAKTEFDLMHFNFIKLENFFLETSWNLTQDDNSPVRIEYPSKNEIVQAESRTAELRAKLKIENI